MSTTETTSSVIPSTNRGRYALSEPDEGDDRDPTDGDAPFILLGGQWRKGQIEHARRALLRYPHRPGTTTSWDGGIQPGYSYIARDGSVCGLCTGMQVCLLWEDETRRNTAVNRIRTKEESTIVQWEAHRSHARFALLFPTQKLARMLSGDGRAVLETVGNNQMLEVSSSILPGRPLRRKSAGTHKEGPALQSQLYTASWRTRSAACLEQAGYRCEECGIHVAHSGGLSITPDEGSAGYRWTIGELSGVAFDVLEAISLGLHSLHLDPLEQLERRLA